MLNAPSWQLGAEAIAIKIRWLGVALGYLYVNLGSSSGDQFLLNALIGLGACFTILDTVISRRGLVLFGQYPLTVSVLEAVFIGLLCYFDAGLQSPFRYYYLLSVICTAIRHSARVTYLTCALDCASFVTLSFAIPDSGQEPYAVPWMIVVLVWVSWASSALAGLLKRAGEHLRKLNSALRENQAMLEQRIEDRSRQLRDAQAMVLHQEKMAGFGLLAAGIAHEVGNPLTSISSLVQMLQRRATVDQDEYSTQKLALVGGQLKRIQITLRELVDFSRPANPQPGRFRVGEVVREAMNIAKYYKGTKSCRIETDLPEDLPVFEGLRDQFVQVFFNLILNALDATSKDGRIWITAQCDAEEVCISVADDGCGLAEEHWARLFQPYFTTKRQGTGLGLFVTQKLVEQHGGRVAFQSVPGDGTTVSVYLPLLIALPSSRPRDASAREGGAQPESV